MQLPQMPPGAIDWASVAAETASGTTGTALGRAVQHGDVQMRVVDYGSGYVADHWCAKGHILFVVSGNLVIEHEDGTKFELSPGMVWHVGDAADGGMSFPPHRVVCQAGARVFIVD